MIRPLNYQEAISVLTSQGKFYIKLGLERISAILDLLGNPQDSLKVIHVAGTNGKGSTCAMLSSVLDKAGYNVGMYTSPHLIDYIERIKINNGDISRDEFSQVFSEIHGIAQENEIHLTEFEILTAMAFLYFKKRDVDIAIIETGLGGRFDATNVIKESLFSIITSVDLDHVDRLGDSIEKIAVEKAGIIKPCRHVLVNEDNKGIEVIKEHALKHGSQVLTCKDDFEIDYGENIFSNEKSSYEMSLMGKWQSKNLVLVLKAVELLGDLGFKVNADALKEGLKSTSWSARMQYLKNINLVVDGAHNLAAAKLLRESLDLYFPNKKRVWMYGSLKNKDYSSIMKTLFSEGDTVFFTECTGMSSAEAGLLEREALSFYPELKTLSIRNIKKCINEFLSQNANGSILVIAGSLYLSGDALALLSSGN